jgi:hypothetical protein
MSIVQLLTASASFDPEATKILTTAFDTAWQTLKTSGNVLAADFRAASTRELLAKRIIEMGRRGERDPLRLVEDALGYIENPPRP